MFPNRSPQNRCYFLRILGDFAHFLAVRLKNRDTLITNKSGNTITWLIKETQLDRFEAALEQYS